MSANAVNHALPIERRRTMERKIEEIVTQGATISERYIKDSVADAYREATRNLPATEAQAIARQLSVAFWIASQPLDEAT